MRVLIVDDEQLILSFTTQCLELSGFEAVGAVSAADALSAMERASFDVVITDMSMAPVNGIELAREIRRVDNSVRIILATGLAASPLVATDAAVCANGEQLFDATVSKPYKIEHLVQLIHAVAPAQEN
ncbi:MAG: response regulator [Burkholderiaceae bacterium]